MPRTVLVIDDEPDLLKLVEYNLGKDGWLVLTARDGEAGLATARQQAPQVVLLDVMMPGLDGWEVLKRLRADAKTASIPVLMLTAKGQEADRVLGLELGADDYIVKPFSVRELAARIKAVRRRFESASRPGEVLRVGPLSIDSGRREAAVGGRALTLTTTEFNLLRALAEKPGRVFTREDLIASARGEDAVVTDRTIDVHVAALRKKLAKHAELLETVRGVGYRWRAS